MMVGVVTSGTGKKAAIDTVNVGGKTGTAETAPGQAADNWFVGFADDGAKHVVVAVVVENGGKLGMAGAGGTVAAPIAHDVMRAVLQ
jgi:peptidoglycan glycosyltransferase